jgi:predicted nucleotidyltransferase
MGAGRNDAVAELWIFGSRAKGNARQESDVDVGLVMMPAKGKHDWALGAYFALESEWKRQLEAIVGRRVSIEPVVPDTKGDVVIRGTGILLWERSSGPHRSKDHKV